MKKQKMLTVAIIASTLFLLALIFVYGVSTCNKEITLHNKVEAQKQVCESYFDKMWKVLQQKAQVTDEYKNTFKEIYPALIEGRYSNEKGGTLMKWIQESNPSFDVSLYKDLMSSIESERTGFFMEQKELVDIHRELETFKKMFPNSIFIGHSPEVKITIVSSEKTKSIMESGKEEEVDLFKHK